MFDALKVIFWLIAGLFRSQVSLEAENAVLRHQINVLRRQFPKRPAFTNFVRFIFTALYRWAHGIVNDLAIVQPETVVRWHRAGFRALWRCKSHHPIGRPSVPRDIQRLIRQMSVDNPLWGAPRIHGEILKLGIDVCQTSVAK